MPLSVKDSREPFGASRIFGGRPRWVVAGDATSNPKKDVLLPLSTFPPYLPRRAAWPGPSPFPESR
jgi:hypothetical protein